MLQPKKRKFRKDFRGKRRGLSIKGSSISYGQFGIKSLDRGWLAANQIEAGRRAITNSIKRGGRVWVRVFPGKPVTSRPAGQRIRSPFPSYSIQQNQSDRGAGAYKKEF